MTSVAGASGDADPAESLRRRLLPRPRRLRLGGDAAVPEPGDGGVGAGAGAGGESRAWSAAQVRWSTSPGRPTGSVWLRVGPGAAGVAGAAASPGIDVTLAAGGESAGRRRALAILEQLRTELGPVDRWPRLEIEDAPRIARLGVMLDVSRDRVPTMDALRRGIEQLASVGFDHLQYYTEHAFAYAGCEAVWGEASPITAEELRSLDAAAAECGIELAANQNCFGHLHRWLATPAFSHLAETHGRFDFFGVERQGPFSLCPTYPASLEFVRRRLEQLLPCVGSPLVNIGCDETADVGAGRSADAVRRRGKAAVERAFTAAIAGVVRDLGRTPMFWADMALREPEGIAELPAELIALAWGYEDDDRIAEAAGTLAALGRRFWVCPGTASWRSLAGRPAERRGNLRRAADAARTHAAGGMLVTDWGDCGHRQPWIIALHALGEAAALAWDPEDPEEGRDEAIARHLLGQPTGVLGPWLRDLGDADLAIRQIGGDGGGHLHNASALFEDLHPSGLPTALPPEPGPWMEVVDHLEALAARQPLVTGPGFAADVEHAVQTAAFAARRAAWRRDPAARRDPARRRELAERLEAVVAGHDRMRARDARPGGGLAARRWWTDLEAGVLEPPGP